MYIKRFVILSLSIMIAGLLLFSGVGEDTEDAVAAKAEAKTDITDVYKVILEGESIVLYICTPKGKKELKRAEVSPLREHDIRMLSSGVMTDNLQDALMILEDFTS